MKMQRSWKEEEKIGVVIDLIYNIIIFFKMVIHEFKTLVFFIFWKLGIFGVE